MSARILAMTALAFTLYACKSDTEPTKDADVGDDIAVTDTTVPTDGVPDTDDATGPEDTGPDIIDEADVADVVTADVIDTEVVVTTSCDDATDCQHCTWTKNVATVADCYCPICPVSVTTKSDCDQRRTEWDDVCTGWAVDNPCPVAICMPKAPALCDETQTCVADVYGCGLDRDCMRCDYAEAPTAPEDCGCPTCGTPMTQVQCDDITAAVDEHCPGLLDECPPCRPVPAELTCSPDDARCHDTQR